LKTIDAHIHFAGDHEECVAVLKEKDIKAMNICLAYQPGQWKDQKQVYGGMARKWPDRFAWCTTFDPPDYTSPDRDYQERVRAELTQDLQDGAVACKVWKNIGMEFKTPSGEYLMVDHPIFSPIFEELEGAECAVVLHIGEPLEWWKPLDPGSPHYDYLTKDHPEWYCYPKKNYPSHQELMKARDIVLGRYPKMRFIGAHLGSLEYDLSVLAQTLDRFPNLMVDTSARIEDFGVLHSPGDVHDFLERYQDRITYGSDQMEESPQSLAAPEIRKKNAEELRQAYTDHHRYFTTRDRFRFLGKDISGVGLSDRAVQKIMRDNAASWYGL
jgi:predicted TIM-barrel fold metal-dependent hydrolase